MILYPCWVEITVNGKTLMMNYEKDLVSLVILTLYLNYGYLWLTDDDVLKYTLLRDDAVLKYTLY